MQFIPGITVRGIDISAYAIENAKEEVKDFVSVADARELPFEDNSFDCAISITTIHNLDYEGCVQALSEMERVSPGKGFITVDAYENEEEKRRMDAWNLTAKTVLHHDEWRELFDKAGYKGDYFWFTP
jgi:ubiquinone/menaquinone biosynthesis C-methylase UbiE